MTVRSHAYIAAATVSGRRLKWMIRHSTFQAGVRSGSVIELDIPSQVRLSHLDHAKRCIAKTAKSTAHPYRAVSFQS